MNPFSEGVSGLLEIMFAHENLNKLYVFVSSQFGLSSPLSPVYFAAAALICWLWLDRVEKMSWSETRLYLKKHLQAKRTMICSDFLWCMGHFAFLRVPLLWIHGFVFQSTYKSSLWIGLSLDASSTLKAPRWLEGLLATAITMLAIDAAAYLVHRLLHSHPLLWRAHRLHHASTFLTPFTAFRQHPLEALLLASARGLAAGLGLGCLHLLLPQCTAVWTVAGMGLGFFLYMFTVHLHHAPVPVRYPPVLATALMSPHLHHIHHSRAEEHYDVNFGVVFSIWDRMGSTLVDLKLRRDELDFGLSEQARVEEKLCENEEGSGLPVPLTLS